jgi:hypothetical protein
MREEIRSRLNVGHYYYRPAHNPSYFLFAIWKHKD